MLYIYRQPHASRFILFACSLNLINSLIVTTRRMTLSNSSTDAVSIQHDEIPRVKEWKYLGGKINEE